MEHPYYMWASPGCKVRASPELYLSPYHEHMHARAVCLQDVSCTFSDVSGRWATKLTPPSVTWPNGMYRFLHLWAPTTELWASSICELCSSLWPVYVSILRVSPSCKLCASPCHMCASRIWDSRVSRLGSVCLQGVRFQTASFVLPVLATAGSNFTFQDGQFQFRAVIWLFVSDTFRCWPRDANIQMFYYLKSDPPNFWSARLMRCCFCKIRTVLLRRVTCYTNGSFLNFFVPR